MTTSRMSCRAAMSTLGRFQATTKLSRLPNFGLHKQSLIISSFQHWDYFFFPRPTDGKWICSTPVSLRGEYKTPNRNDSRRGASIAINKTIIELGSKKDFEGILEFFIKNKDNFNNVNYATVMIQLGRIRSLDRADTRFLAYLVSLLESIEKRGLPWIQVRPAANIIYAMGKMRLINPSTKRIFEWISRRDTANQFVEEALRMGDAQSIANTVWAFATLQVEAPQFLSAIDARSDLLVENGNTQDIANTVWAFATLKTDAPKLLSAIEARSDWLVENGNAQNMANTAWAFATLKTEAPKLLSAIEGRSDWLIQNGTTQEVVNTAWAFARLQANAPTLFSAIEARSDGLVQNGTPQEIANTAWAFAALKTDAPTLLSAIEARATLLVENGTPQGVANTVWAFATLKTDAPKLLSAIEARSAWLVQNGNAQDMANTAWAFAALKTEAPKLLFNIEARSDWLVENGMPQEVANTAWAFATLKTEAPKLFAAIEARSDWLVGNGTTQEVVNTAWAFATNGFEGTTFFDALDQNPRAVLGKELKPQNVANLCFAIAIAGRVSESAVLLLKAWEKAIQLFEADAIFLDEEFWQLAQSQVFASAWGVELSPCPVSMTNRMEALQAQSAEDNVVSRSSKEVSKILRDIDFDHECEVAPDSNTLGGMMAIDFACARRKVAIEFDGDSHFLKALGSGELTAKRNGSTKAKRRLLEQLGWTVINVDFRDYMEACRKFTERAWLCAELKQVGVKLT